MFGYSNVFRDGVSPDSFFTAIHNFLRPKSKLPDTPVIPSGEVILCQKQYCEWVSKNIAEFHDGTYFVLSWNRFKREVFLYPGLGAKWKDGTTVKGQMPILKKSHLLLEECVLGKPVPLVQRFIFSKPYSLRGGGMVLKNGQLKIEFFSNVPNERWSPSNGGYIENEYRQELVDDIKKLTGIGVVG
jgi:hypothetical protein